MRINPDFDFRHLEPAARIQLAHNLWDSLTPEHVDADRPLTAEQEAELDRRLADLERNPDAGVPLAQVRAVIQRERETAREAELLEMFNRAAEEVTEEDIADRRLFMQAHPNRD